jgi:hypothetical protein
LWQLQLWRNVAQESNMMNALRRYDVSPWLGAKLQLQMAPEKGMSQSMLDLEFKVTALRGDMPNAYARHAAMTTIGQPALCRPPDVVIILLCRARTGMDS